MRRSTVLSFPLQLVFPDHDSTCFGKLYDQVVLASGSSTVVEPSTHDPKFEGSNPAAASTGGQCYKTFYGRKLRLFIIS